MLVLAAAATPLEAAPDLSTARRVSTLTVYADSTNHRLYYYGPPGIELAKDADGKPDFHFLATRYTGTATSKDRGEQRYQSLISFRVRLPRTAPEEIARVAREVGAPVGPAELRPLPIRALKTMLVYTTVGAGSDTVSLPEGRLEADPEGAGTGRESYWTERVCNVGLDPLSSQVFQKALDLDRVILSVDYAFLAAGSTDIAGDLSGDPTVVAEIQRALGSQAPLRDSAATAAPALHVVRAGAIEIGLDVKRWPDLMRRVDLNDRIPPGYAALDVYCYDFNNTLRTDLAEKRVEIEAEAIGGRRVKLDASFRHSDPDVFSAGIRFPVAVRLDRPYRYRLTETKLDGSSAAGRWREVTPWNRILDVTSAPPTQGVRSILGP